MSGRKDKALFLYTTDFPYGYGESFLENELPVLVEHFHKVWVIPFNPYQGYKRELPHGAELLEIPHHSPSSYGLKALLQNCPLLVRVLLAETRKGRSSFHLTRIRYFKNNLLHKKEEAEKLHRILSEKVRSEKAVHYSYWFNNRVMELSLLKDGGKIGPWVTRTHRHDLYRECAKEGFFPYRSFQMKEVDRVYPVSQQGKRHLDAEFPSQSDKIGVSYLGVHDKGISPVEGKEKVNRVVTCCDFRPVKRGELMVRILSHLKDLPIEWVHFGEGEEFEMVKGLAREGLEGGKLQYEFQGKKSNQEILRYYQDLPVHLLLNVSSSEGLPVSMMEAISFGIPVIGTAVGGVPELVTKRTGELLPPNPEASETANTIRTFLQEKAMDQAFRKGVRKFWAEHFDAEKNYREFAEELKGLGE